MQALRPVLPLLCLPALAASFAGIDVRPAVSCKVAPSLQKLTSGCAAPAHRRQVSGSCRLAMVSTEQSQSAEAQDGNSAEENEASGPMSVDEATKILTNFDAAQQSYMQADGMRGMGGGTSALSYIQTALSPTDREQMKAAVITLINQAHKERAVNSAKGRIMLGICAENAPEALGGLKSWVTTLALPRGMLHGMDVDGVPIPPEDLGSVYVKFSTGGAMTFKQMRDSKMGFDALWRPGDALLEPYDGDFRGVYLNVELSDEVFRQFGVLPTDLFMDLDDDW